MKRALLLILLILAIPATISIAQTLCTQSAVISVTAGSTGEIVPLELGRTVQVCSWTITGNTAVTGAQWQTGTGTTCGTGTANKSGVMLMPVTGSISSPVTFQGTQGAAVCLAATTGAVTGIANYRYIN